MESTVTALSIAVAILTVSTTILGSMVPLLFYLLIRLDKRIETFDLRKQEQIDQEVKSREKGDVQVQNNLDKVDESLSELLKNLLGSNTISREEK